MKLRNAFKNAGSEFVGSREYGLSRSESIAEFFSIVESISSMEITQAIATLQQQLRELTDVVERVVTKPRVRQAELDLVWRMLRFIEPHVSNLKDTSGELRLHVDRLKSTFGGLKESAELASDRVRKRSDITQQVLPAVQSPQELVRAHFRVLEKKQRREDRKRFEEDRRKSYEKKKYLRATSAAQRLNGSGVLRHTGELGSHRKRGGGAKRANSGIMSNASNDDEDDSSSSDESMRIPRRGPPSNRPSASRIDPSLGLNAVDVGGDAHYSRKSSGGSGTLTTRRGDPTLGFSGYTPKRQSVKSNYDSMRSTPEIFRTTPETPPVTVKHAHGAKSLRKKKGTSKKNRTSENPKSPRSPRFSAKWGSTGRGKGSSVIKGVNNPEAAEYLQTELRRAYRVRKNVYVVLNPKADCDYYVCSSVDDKTIGSVNLVNTKFCFFNKKGKRLKEISDASLFNSLKKEAPKRASLLTNTFDEVIQSPASFANLAAPPPIDDDDADADAELQKAEKMKREMGEDGVELNADGDDLVFRFETLESHSSHSSDLGVEFFMSPGDDDEEDIDGYEQCGMITSSRTSLEDDQEEEDKEEEEEEEQQEPPDVPLMRKSGGPPRKMLPKTPSELQLNQEALDAVRTLKRFPQKPPPKRKPAKPVPKLPIDDDNEEELY